MAISIFCLGSNAVDICYNGFLDHINPEAAFSYIRKFLHGFDLRCNKDDIHES